MDTLLDVLTGVGVALAVGLRPFLPALVVGLLALADLTIDFDGTGFSFLESPVVLVLLAVLTVAWLVFERRYEGDTARLGLTGIAALVGALLAAGTLDEHTATWWPGAIFGAGLALLAAYAVQPYLDRVAKRLDAETQGTLPFYVEAIAAVTALLSVLLPPVGLVALVGVLLVARGGRRREGEKYAGLRILR